MKRYARILLYLKDYRGKLVLYILCTLLATLFSLVALSFLSPFMEVIFKGDHGVNNGAINSNSVTSLLKIYLNKQIALNGKVYVLGIICLFIVIATVLKISSCIFLITFLPLSEVQSLRAYGPNYTTKFFSFLLVILLNNEKEILSAE